MRFKNNNNCETVKLTDHIKTQTIYTKQFLCTQAHNLDTQTKSLNYQQNV